MQLDADWCSLVQLGATWFSLVQLGATWCKLVQVSVTSCRLVEVGAVGATWCSLVQLGADWCMHGCIRFVRHVSCQSHFMFHSNHRAQNIIQTTDKIKTSCDLRETWLTVLDLLV